MRRDVLATVRPPTGLDGQAYVDAVLARFRNEAVRHRLVQIAADGSQKLPARLGAAAREAMAADRLAVPFAAWMRWVVREVRCGPARARPTSRPPILQAAMGACSGNSARDVDAFLARSACVPEDLAATPRRAVCRASRSTAVSSPPCAPTTAPAPGRPCASTCRA